MLGDVKQLGLELVVLTHHLYGAATSSGQQHGNGAKRTSGAQAYRELALRTRTASSDEDASSATTCARLRNTDWYRVMAARYASLLHATAATRQFTRAAEEARELMISLYPDGCVDVERQLSSVFSTCASMLTDAVPTHVLDNYTQLCILQSVESRQAGSGPVSVKTADLADLFVKGPLLAAAVPKRWWESDDASSGAAQTAITKRKVTAVALCVQPHPSIIIEYIADGTAGVRRWRRIDLRNTGFSKAGGSVSALARRLVQSHGALLTESELQKYLFKLQGLLRESSAEGTRASNAASSPADTPQSPPLTRSAPVEAAAKTAAASSGATSKNVQVQKADLGLLYRDPEKALTNVDLNDADDVTLEEFKAKMDERFQENVLRPGDPGYVYDKRVTIAEPTAKSEWDDSDDDEDDE